VTALALTACSGDRVEVEEPMPDFLGYPEGAGPVGDPLSTIEAVGLFLVAPLTIVLLIAALVWLPGMVKGNRYRPAHGWSASPLWFGGPPDPAAAVESAQVGDLVRGGASGSW
jgi:hypothetical protein